MRTIDFSYDIGIYTNAWKGIKKMDMAIGIHKINYILAKPEKLIDFSHSIN